LRIQKVEYNKRRYSAFIHSIPLYFSAVRRSESGTNKTERRTSRRLYIARINKTRFDRNINIPSLLHTFDCPRLFRISANSRINEITRVEYSADKHFRISRVPCTMPQDSEQESIMTRYLAAGSHRCEANRDMQRYDKQQITLLR